MPRREKLSPKPSAKTQEHRIVSSKSIKKSKDSPVSQRRRVTKSEDIAKTREHPIGRSGSKKIVTRKEVAKTREYPIKNLTDNRRLEKTQEHRILPKPSLGQTQEYRLSDAKRRQMAKTLEYRKPPNWDLHLAQTKAYLSSLASKQREIEVQSIWEPIDFFFGAGIGLIALPLLANTFWQHRLVYPYGITWFWCVLGLGILAFLQAAGWIRTPYKPDPVAKK